MTSENYYIKGLVAILDTPLAVKAFEKVDENGVPLSPIENWSVRGFVTNKGQTIERYSNDGIYFIKGFLFDLATLNEIQAKFADYGLTLGVDVFILNKNEVAAELALPEWNTEIVV